jgi:septal ring factor EnvC (AmiA/AmiB activator)
MRPLLVVALALAVTGAGLAQGLASDPRIAAQAADARVRALQREADTLAQQARTLLNELRSLEIERQIKREHVAKANAELKVVTRETQLTEARLTALEEARHAEAPRVSSRMVEMYKRGKAGYVRMILGTGDLSSIGRRARGVTAVARFDNARIEQHRRIVREEEQTLAELHTRRTAVAAAQREATKAQEQLAQVAATYNQRLDELDQRRDLAARYLGELQSAQSALTNRVASLGGVAETRPIAPLKGQLEWPVAGDLLSRFGRSTGQFGTAIVRNGIEVTAEEGAEVRAVHSGTVAYAAAFTGYATLVILDHGDNAFTLYGHLNETTVTSGGTVARGGVVGRAGRTPAGTPAVYFELRIDGRPVDPVQWLRSTR